MTKTPVIAFGDPRVPVRFWKKIRVSESGCWVWQSALDNGGYGKATLDKKTWKAHRMMYTLTVAEVARGVHMDHLCRVRACVNPNHMEPVTARENVMRSPIAPAAINSLKTHCVNNHEFTESNTEWRKDGNRTCVECRRAAGRRYLAKNAELMREKNRSWYRAGNRPKSVLAAIAAKSA